MTSFRTACRQALTPELRYPEARLTWTLRAALVATAIYGLATAAPGAAITVVTGATGLAASVGFAFVPTRRPRTLKAAEAFVLASFLLHAAGHAFGWYDRFDHYDKLLHTVVPFAAALTLWALSQASHWLWDWRHVPALPVGVYLFAMVVTLGTLWEIVEFTMDQLLGTDEQNGLADTMLDLVADTVGALAGAALVAALTHYGHEHGMDHVSEDPKRNAPRRGPARRGAD